VNAIMDGSTEPREFQWKGAVVMVKAARVEVGQGKP
jgi:hypothetical protein